MFLNYLDYRENIDNNTFYGFTEHQLNYLKMICELYNYFKDNKQLIYLITFFCLLYYVLTYSNFFSKIIYFI